MEGIGMRSFSGTRIVPARAGTVGRPREISVAPLARHLLWCLAAALLVGCGERGAGRSGVATISGPPSWRELSAEDRLDGSGAAIRAGSPLRMRFRLETAGGESTTGRWVSLGSGQSRHVLWRAETGLPSVADDLPAPDDEAAGRTEVLVGGLRYQFSEAAVNEYRFTFWSRPGQGRMLSREVLPPGAYEPLGRRTLELVTFAATDLVRGEAKLRRREPRNRVVLPTDPAPGDHHATIRLFLQVEPLPSTAD
jgi:hypothetical protein